MNYTITINASTPEELSLIISKLQTTEPAPVVQHPAIQDQPTYQQHQAIQQTPPVYYPPPQEAGPVVTYQPPVSYEQPVGAQPPVAYGQPAVPVAPAQQAQGVPATVPVTPQTYTMEQLAVAATPINDAGRGPELTALLQQFGVQTLTQLPKERYGEFATALRQMGAKI